MTPCRLYRNCDGLEILKKSLGEIVILQKKFFIKVHFNQKGLGYYCNYRLINGKRGDTELKLVSTSVFLRRPQKFHNHFEVRTNRTMHQ